MATHLLNLVPTTTLSFHTQFEILFQTFPSYSHLRVFGCLYYPNLTATAPRKLAQKSTPCVFLGYPPNHRGYRCLDLRTNKIIISRHVTFDEDTFPYTSLPPTSPTSLDFLPPEDDTHPVIPHLVANNHALPPLASDVSASPASSPTPSPSRSVVSPSLPEHSPPSSATSSSPFSPPPAVPSAPPPSPPGFDSSPPHRGSRHPMITRARDGIVKPCQILNLSSQLTPSPIPRSYTQALRDQNWKNAMEEELRALHSNNTWDLVTCPPNTNIQI